MIFPDQTHSVHPSPYIGGADFYKIWLVVVSGSAMRVLAKPLKPQLDLVELYSVSALPVEKNIPHFAEFLEPLTEWLQLSLRKNMFDRLILNAENDVCRQIYQSMPSELSRRIMAEMNIIPASGSENDRQLQDIFWF